MKKLIVPLLAVLCLVSCSKENDCCKIETANNEIKTVTNINNDLLLKLVNDLRVEGCNCGSTVMPPVKPLTWNAQLASAAISHSDDMASAQVLQHASTDGKMVGDRVTATGYNWINVGENIAQGHTSEEHVFNAWLASAPHCKNMMNAVFKEMGAAKSSVYWTQVFATAK